MYHVLNRGVGRRRLFEDADDYAAFVRVMAEAVEREPGVRLLGYCVMPNHWHLVVWPEADGQLSEFMRWLTVTHTGYRNRHVSRYRALPQNLPGLDDRGLPIDVWSEAPDLS